jgi:hypothetical protein
METILHIAHLFSVAASVPCVLFVVEQAGKMPALQQQLALSTRNSMGWRQACHYRSS